jgi:hypothetical protein
MNPDVMPVGFAQVIEKYIRAHEEGWSVEEYMQSDICYVLGMQDSIWEYGYALMDLNEDGIDELLITDGKLIYDLYILMEDGSAGHIISAGERARYYLCEGNIIGYRGSGGAANTVMEFFRVLPSGDFQYELKLEFDDGTWYTYKEYGKETPGGVDVVSEEQAQDLINGYAPVEVVFQAFLRPETAQKQEHNDVLPAGFASVLQKYVRVHEESWTAEKCTKNDISYMVSSKNIFWQYGYALMDLNGDGSNELIITDGEEVYDVYMLLESGEANHIIKATENHAYSICENNIIGYHSFGGNPDSCWEFSRLLPSGDSEIVMYLQKDADGWFKMEGSTDKMVTISHNEADE